MNLQAKAIVERLRRTALGKAVTTVVRSVLLLGKRVQAQLHSPRSTPQRSTPRVSRTYNGYTAQQVATTHATLADTRSVI
ncbi:hypothetical protein, partial [Actinoalloteichus caeruleus]